MKKILLVAALVSLAGCSHTIPAPNAGNERIVPEPWRNTYEEWGYAPAVRAGDELRISGVPAGGPGTVEEQVARAYATIDRLLREAGFERADIVELTTYHVVDSTEEFHAHFAEYSRAHKKYFSGIEYPAWSAVGVTALLAPGAVAEIRVVARKTD